MATINPNRSLAFSEEDAQAVALIRAIEEIDRAGHLLPLTARRSATAASSAADREEWTGERATGQDFAWLATRARELTTVLDEKFPFLIRFRRWTRLIRGLVVPVAGVAFVLGVATNALGPAQRINVLAVPLLGLILWNLVILAFLAIKSVVPVGRAALGSGMPGFVRVIESRTRRLIDRLPVRRVGEGDRDLLRSVLERYLTVWMEAVAPLAASRGRRLLHVSSLMLILGVVIGMYLRGIAFQFEATWESTFLSGPAVDRFLATILKPAAILIGGEVPGAMGIESPNSGDAGPWIHLWAATAALFVALPRMTLVAFESLKCRRRERRLSLSLPAGYLRRLQASANTSERRLEVLPFSYRPSAKTVEVLKQMLFDLFGPRSEIRVREPLDYGSEAVELEPGGCRLRLLLFGLAQTPEVEVHGELLETLRQDLPDGQVLLVVVDASSYRQRLEGSGQLEKRLGDRRRAWDRVIRDAGMVAVHVDPGESLDDELLMRATEAAWPAGALENDA